MHGYSTVEQERLGRRTAATSAAFFLPHLRPAMDLLDCGCGPGSITLGLAEVVALGLVVGIDVGAAQIERARQLAAERQVRNARFEVGDVHRLPFADASLDAVFAHTVLRHAGDPTGPLREFRRVLKPGGVVGVCDDDEGTLVWEPSSPRLRELHALWVRIIEHRGGQPYYARRLRRLLLDAGFVRTEGYATVTAGGHWGKPEDTRFFAQFCLQQLREPVFVDLVLGQGWADQAALSAMAEEVVAWGERPDAFFSVTAFAAVGWVSNPG